MLLGSFCSNVILGPTVAQQWVPVVGVESRGQADGRAVVAIPQAAHRLRQRVKDT
jgi:hypothetical protein